MIAPTDPRHGHRAGYIAGCRQECCRTPHLHYQKRSNLRRHREGTQWVDPTELFERLDQWASYGVTERAIGLAAGLSDSTLPTIRRENTRALKSTIQAVLAVTWDDLHDTALVNMALTKQRIQSMQAVGHTLAWICAESEFNVISGKWREQECTTLGVARSIQALYERAPIQGPSRQVASKARGYGYPVPAAWDDPGLPAMPHGWQPAPTVDPVEPLSLRDAALRAKKILREAFFEDAEFLADMGYSISEVSRRTGRDKETIQRLCSRHGRSDLYRRLAAREGTDGNQHNRRAS